MPSPHDVEFARLTRLIDGNLCARDTVRGNLLVAWVAGAWVVRCGQCGLDPPLAYDPGLVDRYQRGDALPEHQRLNAERILDREARRSMADNQQTQLTVAQQRDVVLMRADEPTMTLALQAKWPRDLEGAAAIQFLMVAQAFGLNPMMGEIVPYQGSPYIPIKGLVAKASRSGHSVIPQTRAATQQERIDQLCDPEDHLWKADVWVDGASHPVSGWGKVTVKEMTETKAYADNVYNRDRHRVGEHYLANPVLAAKPAEMAESRALHDALERSGVLHLPSIDPDTLLEMGVRLLDARMQQGVISVTPPEEEIQAAMKELTAGDESGAQSSAAEQDPHKVTDAGSTPAGPTFHREFATKSAPAPTNVAEKSPAVQAPAEPLAEPLNPMSETAQPEDEAGTPMEFPEPYPELDMLLQCWIHPGADWDGRGFHRVQGSNNPCNRQALLTMTFRDKRIALGMKDDEVKPWIERHLGKQFPGRLVLTDEERCRLLYFLRVENAPPEEEEPESELQAQLEGF